MAVGLRVLLFFRSVSGSETSFSIFIHHPLNVLFRHSNCVALVVPFGIIFFNERYFPFSSPPLQLLLAADGSGECGERFKVNKPFYMVAAGEALVYARLMLRYPPLQVVGDPCIEHTVALAGKNIDKSFV